VVVLRNMKSEPYQWANQETLEEINQALTLVGGSFIAAAKLVDLEPQRFRNLINHHPGLKKQWGQRRGRSPIRTGLRIKPFVDVHVQALRQTVEFVKIVFRHLTPAEQEHVKAWIEAGHLKGPTQKALLIKLS